MIQWPFKIVWLEWLETYHHQGEVQEDIEQMARDFGNWYPLKQKLNTKGVKCIPAMKYSKWHNPLCSSQLQSGKLCFFQLTVTSYSQLLVFAFIKVLDLNNELILVWISNYTVVSLNDEQKFSHDYRKIPSLISIYINLFSRFFDGNGMII